MRKWKKESMLLVWIPVSVLAMYFVLNMVYGKFWKEGLRVQLLFEERDVEEGDVATLVETVTNDKILPLPVLTLTFKVDRSIVIDEDRNAIVSDKTNVAEYFGLGAHEEITRRQPVKAAKRGYYLIEEAGVTLPDFPRDNDWWRSGEDLYSANFEEAGFRAMTPEEQPEAGDVALIIVPRSNVVNHAAVYLGGGLILHHLYNRLSVREPVGRWQRHIVRWIRYET